jgi:hypothetical protein
VKKWLTKLEVIWYSGNKIREMEVDEKMKKIILLSLIVFVAVGTMPTLVKAEKIGEGTQVSEDLMELKKAMREFGYYEAKAIKWRIIGLGVYIGSIIVGVATARGDIIALGGLGSLGCWGYSVYNEWKGYKALEERAEIDKDKEFAFKNL